MRLSVIFCFALLATLPARTQPSSRSCVPPPKFLRLCRYMYPASGAINYQVWFPTFALSALAGAFGFGCSRRRCFQTLVAWSTVLTEAPCAMGSCNSSGKGGSSSKRLSNLHGVTDMVRQSASCARGENTPSSSLAVPGPTDRVWSDIQQLCCQGLRCMCCW